MPAPYEHSDDSDRTYASRVVPNIILIDYDGRQIPMCVVLYQFTCQKLTVSVIETRQDRLGASGRPKLIKGEWGMTSELNEFCVAPLKFSLIGGQTGSKASIVL